MRIVIDGRLWFESGIGRYLRNLVFNLQKIDCENEYFILLLEKDFVKVDLSSNFKKVVADFRWYTVSEQVRLPKILNSLHPDLVHFPHFNVPLLFKGKYVVTIHDLIHLHFKMRQATTRNPLVYQIKQLGYRRAISHAVKNAAAVITPSKFVRDQLIKKYSMNSKKINVTYEAADEAIINISKQIKKNDFQKISAKFKVKEPYFYYVGNAHPHKNLPQLIKAFNKFRQTRPQYSLVLSGPEHRFWQQLQKSEKAEGVVFTGFVSDKELVTFYKYATTFINPSREEGFGIPILEAMACGCPVISSNAASLSEVGAKAALYFDPMSDDEMVNQMERLTGDERLRQKLIKNGLARYKEFSWKKMARETLQVYQDTLKLK